jgi:DNA-binding CsgD family transcriptional regulator
METLTSENVHKLLDGIHAIYGLRDLDAFAQNSLAILEQLVPTEASMLARLNTGFTQPQFHFNTPDFGNIFTPEYVDVCQELQPTHPFIQNAPLLLQGGAHTFSDWMTQSDVHHHPGYEGAIKPLGYDDQIGMVICFDASSPYQSEGLFALYNLFLDWGRFTERDRLLLNLFQPHLVQAFQNVLYCQQQQQAIAQFQHTLDQSGIIFLDAVGNVLWITAQAERWLQSYDPTPRTNRQLPDVIQTWVNTQIRQLNTLDQVPTVCVPLRLNQGDRQLVIRLVKDPNQDQYLLILAEEQLQSLLTALQQMGLTDREAQILAAIMHGQEPKAIAQTLQIRPATVRKHLENIYRKLHVQSQTEAVALAIDRLGKNFQFS